MALSTTAENNRTRLAHVLIIALDEEGHFIQFLQLLYFVSSLDISVTFCSSTRRMVQIRELQKKGEFKGLDLRLVELSDDEPTAMPPLWEIPNMMKVQFQAYREKVAAETNPDDKPTCLVADSLLDWTEDFAEELQIPSYLWFITAGWIPYAVLKWQIEGGKTGDEIVEIPGHPHMQARAKEFPAALFPLVKLRNAAGLLINTCEELEGEDILEAMRSYLQQMTTKPGSKVPQFLSVGPMAHVPGYLVPARDTGATTDSKALQWLDKQTACSVLYIAFGSMNQISDSLIFELARGLELSKVPFLWALRPSSPTADISTFFPSGFLERVGNRGFVDTDWAPQQQILLHSSTGGFMSHCGWNSTLESLCAGVPMLTWPMYGDQLVNARFVVEGLKVGIPIRQLDSNSGLVVQGEDLVYAIKLLMVHDEGKEVRKNASQYKKLLLDSMKDGGSSLTNLRKFIDEILAR